MNMKQYETFELRFGGEVLPDAWAQIDLTATFSCAQESLTVKGFYDGESDGQGVYVVRFLPQYAGVYRYQVRGAVTAEGKIVCEASSPEAHGIVRAVGTHFAFADGAPYIPFGTTVYALISQDDALVEQTLQSLAAAPFNKLRLCVFPKDYDYNHNEPPLYAFARREDGSWDTSRPSIAFYQRLERILRRIAALGIQLDLILFHPYDRWGFADMPQADNIRYLDYLLRRLSAMPEIWWSLANEYDLCMPKKTLADWEALEAFVASCDPYHHLLSCHNCFCFWNFKRKDVTHASIQTRALTEIPRYLREYGKPVVIDECCYEGDLPHIWGSISGQEMVRRFWRCYVGGGACTHGETFLSPDDVLWWARGGVLKGESPKRIAFLRRVIEELPGFLSPLESVWEEAEQQDEAQRPDWIRPFLASLSRMAPPDEESSDGESSDGESSDGLKEAGESMLSHLMALRKVLLISAAAVLIGFVLVFYLAIDPLMAQILAPIQARGIQVIFTTMSEALVTKFKVALLAGMMIASPVVIWEIWGFIKPALYPQEKRKFRLLFVLALLLFLTGVVFCYFAVYSLAVDFFLVAGDSLATPMLSIDKYVSFLFGFLVPFGVAFQLPVVLYLTTRVGLTTPNMLRSKRKYVILAIFVLAAILTPPDVVSQVALGLPMCGLYEIGILVSRCTKARERA